MSDPTVKGETTSTKTVSNTTESKPLPKEMKTTPKVSLPANVLELEHAVEVAATEAVREYNKAISVLKRSNICSLFNDFYE